MKNFLSSKGTKLSVLFAFAGVIFATLAMWAAVALGFVGIALPLPSTTLLIIFALSALFTVLITMGINLTRSFFKGKTMTWSAALLIPLIWLWIILCIAIISAIAVATIEYFFTVLWVA